MPSAVSQAITQAITLMIAGWMSACDPTTPTRDHSALPTLNVSVNDTAESDPDISTQCLTFDREGALWFTSGSETRSALAKRSDDQVWSRWPIDGYFAEGCAVFEREVLILTWRARKALIFDRERETIIDSFPLSTEGWGLAHSSDGLVYSDGSSSLRWLELSPRDPRSLSVVREATVRAAGEPVYQLNELEWFDGLLLAHLYPSDLIAIIEPERAEVIARLDLSALRSREPSSSRELNGVAYDLKTDTLWVTGKQWSHLYSLNVDELRAQLTPLLSGDHR